MMDWRSIADFAEETARAAGQVLLDHLGKLKDIRGKSGINDLVTEADLASEDLITRRIQNRFPDHSIISEENSVILPDSHINWVVDPLDGTTNFVHQFPEFAVSIGVQYQNQTVAGVVFNPVFNQCFSAYLDGGAYLNGSRVKVSDTSELATSLLLTGFPYKQDELWETNYELFKLFYRNSHGVRRLGAASLDLCYVAAGRFEGFWEFNLQSWDICAGEFILREAGGKTSDWGGGKLSQNGFRVLATNGNIHQQMIKVINQPEFDIFRNRIG